MVEIRINDGENAYEKMRKLIRSGLGSYYDTFLVRMYVSYNGVDWDKVTTLLNAVYDVDEWDYDWWEGQKYIRLVGYIQVDKIDDKIFDQYANS